MKTNDNGSDISLIYDNCVGNIELNTIMNDSERSFRKTIAFILSVIPSDEMTPWKTFPVYEVCYSLLFFI